MVHKAEVRYVATNIIEDYISGTFVVEQGTKSIARVETYTSGVIKIENILIKIC